jgi:hypothetical protein
MSENYSDGVLGRSPTGSGCIKVIILLSLLFGVIALILFSVFSQPPWVIPITP